MCSERMFCAYCPKIARIFMQFGRALSAVAHNPSPYSKNNQSVYSIHTKSIYSIHNQIDPTPETQIDPISEPKIEPASQHHVVACITYPKITMYQEFLTAELYRQKSGIFVDILERKSLICLIYT